MVDVFISYSRANQEPVARLAQAVAAEGYSVWWDAELPPHRSYGDVITEQIGEAKAAIVVWSESAAASEWVRAEADVARQQKKLIQTAIDEIMPPMPFNQIQFAAIGDWRGEPDHPGWRKVKASLIALCGPREPAPDARPVSFPSGPPPAPTAASAAPPPRERRSWLMPALLGLALVVAVAAWFLSHRTHQVVATADSAIAKREQAARFTIAAMIDDPDGFTDVHSGPSARDPIVGRVEEGEAFTTYSQRGDWWQVRTADGHVGYMPSANVHVLNRRVAEIAPAAHEEEGPDEAAASAASDDVKPAAAAAPHDGMIFPDSDTRRLTEADLAGLSAAELALARNEIYARRGRRFLKPALQRHFSRFPWYRPERGEVQLNAVESANVRLIRAAELSR